MKRNLYTLPLMFMALLVAAMSTPPQAHASVGKIGFLYDAGKAWLSAYCTLYGSKNTYVAGKACGGAAGFFATTGPWYGLSRTNSSRPVITFTQTPVTFGSSSSATFAWKTSRTSLDTECSFDMASFTNCTSPRVFSSLPNGTHILIVRARNAYGADYKAYSWMVNGNPYAKTSRYAVSVLSDRPVAYYRLNEGNTTRGGPLMDHSPNMLHGMFPPGNSKYWNPVGNAAGAPVIESTDSATMFVHPDYPGSSNPTGKNSTAVVPDNARLDISSDMTVEAWVRPLESWASLYPILQKGPDDANCYGCDLGRSGNYNLWLKKDSTGDFTLYFSNSNGSAGTSAGTVPMDAWSHVAATWQRDPSSEEGYISLYVNGKLVKQKTLYSTTSPNTNAKPLTLGRLHERFDWSSGFSGYMDEIAIYNYVLDPSRLAEHVQGGRNPSAISDPAPVAHS